MKEKIVPQRTEKAKTQDARNNLKRPGTILKPHGNEKKLEGVRTPFLETSLLHLNYQKHKTNVMPEWHDRRKTGMSLKLFGYLNT